MGSLWLNLFAMPKKKKKKTFSAVKAVKTMSRTAIGKVPSVKRVESPKRVKKEKHKPSIDRLISDAE
jgi:hypothetical protein